MTTRVLICDDSNIARKQMARALPLDWPVEITFAEHGQDALDKLAAGQGEVLFLDLNMPGLDGYAVLAAIKQAEMPVFTIVVSGDIQPQARERVREMGAIDFIIKPTDARLVANLLQEYGLYSPVERPRQSPAEVVPRSLVNSDTNISLNDYLQEIANIAMGRAADLLARLLDVFVKLPVPRVAMIARSELSMALSSVSQHDQCSAVCQGFTGAGLAGEALLLFSDSSFEEMAQLLHYDQLLHDEERQSGGLEIEVLMDMSSILFGAFLKGFGDQLDLKLGLGHPTVLGRHRNVSELLAHHDNQNEHLLSIEINYEIEDHDIACDLLILLTADSVPYLEKNLFEQAE